MRDSIQLEPGQWPELWEAACMLLEQSVVSAQLCAWIHPLEFVDYEKTPQALRIKMAAPNDFSAQWVRDHFQKAIEKALTQVLGSAAEIVLVVKNSSKSKKVDIFESISEETEDSEDLTLQSSSSALSQSGGRNSKKDESDHSAGGSSIHGAMNGSISGSMNGNDAFEGHNVRVAPAPRTSQDQPDTRYTFESFVVGASNQFAHASAIAVAEQPSRQYNPLFLYSPPGLGKTHLLHAIGNRLLAHHPTARVAYLSAEKFVNELIDSLQHRRMSQFRSKYRDSYDMILIDDIQFIAGKNTSEEEFFHTFNALHSSKRQIVVSSDRPPKEIVGLEERVRTRFEWGLIADISYPEIETRIAILKAKAERDDIYLPDEVSTFLATHIKSNVRELEGVLIRLQAQASLTGAEISLEMVKHELRSVVPEGGSNLTIESIQNAVAKHYHLKIPDLKSVTRMRAVALPRQIAMYLIRKYTRIGFKEIGQCFGGKDHTTILHACSKIEAGLETNPEIREAVESIQNLL